MRRRNTDAGQVAEADQLDGDPFPAVFRAEDYYDRIPPNQVTRPARAYVLHRGAQRRWYERRDTTALEYERQVAAGVIVDERKPWSHQKQ